MKVSPYVSLTLKPFVRVVGELVNTTIMSPAFCVDSFAVQCVLEVLWQNPVPIPSSEGGEEMGWLDVNETLPEYPLTLVRVKVEVAEFVGLLLDM